MPTIDSESDKRDQLALYLRTAYPDAREGFVKVMIDALALHAAKNHDYNGRGKDPDMSEFETMAKFADIRRKYSRMFHMIAENQTHHVPESITDTAIDLFVYAGLFVEYIESLKKYQKEKYENTLGNINS